MKLTGKCKEDFDKWYSIEFEKRSLPYIYGFYASDLSVQYGVYVDFFNSVDLQIYIKKTAIEKYSIYIDNIGHHVLDNYVFCENLKEARTAAVEKANEIYNKQ
jgi:hypothetical protein